jgi:hypothetical protein
MSLERAGYEVVSVEGAQDTANYQGQRFDLIILGHTIPREEKRAIATAFLGAGSNIPIVSLIRRGDAPIPEATRAVEPSEKAVTETVQSLLAS